MNGRKRGFEGEKTYHIGGKHHFHHQISIAKKNINLHHYFSKTILRRITMLFTPCLRVYS